MQLEAAPGRDLGDREAATGGVGRPPLTLPSPTGGEGAILTHAGKAAVVLLDHAAAVRAGRGQRGVIARDGVAVVLLGLLDDALRHVGDAVHELVAAELALLHLGELVLPLAGQFGLGQVLHRQAAQQRHQLEGLGRGDELAPLAVHVLLKDQAFDHLRPRGWRAQALLLHRGLELLVVDELAGAFHRAQQRGLAVARGRLGLQRGLADLLGAHRLAGLHRHQVGVLVLRFLAVDGQPARVDQHLAVGLELQFLWATVEPGRHLGDAGGDHELGARVEHRDEALDHQVIELGLDLGQALGCLQRRDDGEVVADLAVVENALAGLDVTVVERLAGVAGQCAQRSGQVLIGDHGQRLFGHADIVFRQGARVGPGVGQYLVFFVQRLGDGQRGLGTEAEARVGLALQRGQVVEQRAGLVAGFGLLGDRAGLAPHRVGDGVRLSLGPEAVGPAFSVVVLLERRVEPLALVQACCRAEVGADFPVGPRDVLADLLLTLDHDGQRRRLHPAHGGEEEATVARVERGHRPRAVDAHQPVGFRPAARGLRQAHHLGVAAQLVEAVADGLRRHALQPQPPDRLAAALGAQRVLLDQAKDQLALAPRVAGVDDGGDVLALDLLDHRTQAGLALVDRLQLEVRRHHRQVREAPLAALDVVGLRRTDLHQMAHRGGDDVLLALEVIGVLLELARDRGQRPHDVLRDRGFFCNDQ